MPDSTKIDLTEELLEDIELANMHHRLWSAWFLDIETSTVIFFTDEIEYDPEFRDFVEHEANRDRFIPIPTSDTKKSWEQVELFIRQIENPQLKSTLTKAMGNKHRFQPFLDEIYYAGLDDEWHNFSTRLDRIEVLNWLFGKNLITKADIEKGKQMYEEALAKRKRGKENQQKMTKGAVVICSDNYGHVNQITPGKTYDVLDERKEHLDIRIKDDRNKIIWIPKAHFELISET